MRWASTISSQARSGARSLLERQRLQDHAPFFAVALAVEPEQIDLGSVREQQRGGEIAGAEAVQQGAGLGRFPDPTLEASAPHASGERGEPGVDRLVVVATNLALESKRGLPSRCPGAPLPAHPASSARVHLVGALPAEHRVPIEGVHPVDVGTGV